MADFYNYCNWYTVWDAKTGDLIASGTSAMVARAAWLQEHRRIYHALRPHPDPETQETV